MEILYSIEKIVNGPFETNSYIIRHLGNNKCIVIDPADGNEINAYIRENNLNIEYIINTHGHYDHISGNNFLKERHNCKVCISSSDNEYLSNVHLNMSVFMEQAYTTKADIVLMHGDKIYLDDIKIEIFYTPGHTPGSVSLILDNNIFVGDLIFVNGIGRTDLPGGDYDTLFDSLNNFFKRLHYNNKIYPGHGEIGVKTIFDKTLQIFGI